MGKPPVIYSVTVHSCDLELVPLCYSDLKFDQQYVITTDASVWYRALPKKCNCRKQVTTAQADYLIEIGTAKKIYDWKVRLDLSRVWMAQQQKVPRVDLIGRTEIERAYVNDNMKSAREARELIEEVHKMYLENRAKLIVPYSPDWQDPTKGDLLFPFGPDQRSQASYSRIRGKK